MKRFNALTGFRCLAACMVFLYHNRKYWRDSLHPELLRLFNEFHTGVSLFFVLSGFLIAYTYGEAPLKGRGAYVKYITIRMARILPLYWLILTAYYLDPAFGKHQFTWLTYSLVHGFSETHNLDGISQSWSLTIEMTFYFLAPLLCLLQRKHILYLLLFVATLFALTRAAGWYWHLYNGNPGNWLYPWKFVVQSSFPGRSAEFMAGMLLAATMKNERSWFHRIPYKTAIGFAGLLLTLYGMGLFQPDRYSHGYDTTAGLLIHHLLIPVFTVLILAGLMLEKTVTGWFFSSRVMVLLGNASFAEKIFLFTRPQFYCALGFIHSALLVFRKTCL
jgi:peptidoglycan/LPS O-acetylase OafA/YrhL